MAHAKIPPSNWEQFTNCPGSANAQDGLPDVISSYADEGTAAHAVLESVLKTRHGGVIKESITADAFLGKPINVAEEDEEPRIIYVDSEMVVHVNACVQYVEKRLDELRVFGPATVRAETEVDPQKLVGSPNSTGTCDIAILSDYEIEIVDFKYGRGMYVPIGTPTDPNGQIMLYLLGVLAEYEFPENCGFEDFRITVFQPRRNNIRSIKLSLIDIDNFIVKAKAAIKAAEAPDAPRIPGDVQCWSCKVKPTCPEANGKVTKSTGAFLHTAVDALTIEQLMEMLDNRDFIRGLLNSVEKYAKELIESGEAPAELTAAYALERGTGDRTWIDQAEESIMKGLQQIRWVDPVTGKTTGLKKKDLIQERLYSPTQIEKRFATLAKQGLITEDHLAAFKRLYERPEGKETKLVRRTAGRVTLPSDEEMFPVGAIDPFGIS